MSIHSCIKHFLLLPLSVQWQYKASNVITPRLVNTYKKLKKAGKEFEIIFVSYDKDEKAHQEYRAPMPWISLPFKDRHVNSLAQLFNVSGEN